jgi:hypothetical protein
VEPLPETVSLTRGTLRDWRERGYRTSEQRVAGWLYLVARSEQDAAVYKVVGPIFDGPLAHYEGRQIA